MYRPYQQEQEERDWHNSHHRRNESAVKISGEGALLCWDKALFRCRARSWARRGCGLGSRWPPRAPPQQGAGQGPGTLRASRLQMFVCLFSCLNRNEHPITQLTTSENDPQYYTNPQCFIKSFLYTDNIQSRTDHQRPQGLSTSYSHIDWRK